MISKWLLFIFSATLIYEIKANAKECECGKEQMSPRVVGGEKVTNHRYPWMVAIHKWEFYKCSGSIISDRVIVTAAHCVEKFDPTEIKVLIGANSLEAEASMLDIASVKIHESFNNRSLENDIALLFLKEKLIFNKTVQRICLQPVNMKRNCQYTVAGWGYAGRKYSAYSDDLYHVDITEYNLTKCVQNWKREHKIVTKKNICAGNIGKDSCKGDSGGPLMQRKAGRMYLIGLVSYGEEECGSKTNSVYTKIRSHLKWIRKHTSDAEFCEMQQMEIV